MSLEKTSIYDIDENFVKLIRKDACITSFGSANHHNALAVGWALIGSLWRYEVAEVYIKPTRYSFNFAENEKYFSLMWFDKNIHEEIIKTYGSLSGRDVDKDKLSNLSLIELDGCACYKEARLIIVCEKIYSHALKEEEILDQNVINMPLYDDKKYHSSYTGKIINVYVNK